MPFYTLGITAQAGVIVPIIINWIQVDILRGFLFQISKMTSISSSVSWSGDSVVILITWVSLPSVREFCRRVLISFIWEKLLSTEAVETGNVKPIEAIFCKFGNIVTSISFVMSSLSCNAMLSSGFLACKVRKVIHSVCTFGEYDSCLYCFFIIQSESKLIFPVVVE